MDETNGKQPIKGDWFHPHEFFAWNWKKSNKRNYSISRFFSWNTTQCSVKNTEIYSHQKFRESNAFIIELISRNIFYREREFLVFVHEFFRETEEEATKFNFTNFFVNSLWKTRGMTHFHDFLRETIGRSVT